MNILGCKECVDQWYFRWYTEELSYLSSKMTMVLLGLNDLLEGIRRLCNNKEIENQPEEQ